MIDYEGLLDSTEFELDNCREDYDELAKENKQLRAELEAIKHQLEAVTPGGSEFYDSPFNCMDWIKSRMSSAGKVAAERNQLRAELDAITATIQAIVTQRDAYQFEWTAALAVIDQASTDCLPLLSMVDDDPVLKAMVTNICNNLMNDGAVEASE